jgi:aminoglycoside 2'-N-acetyltransferase I
LTLHVAATADLPPELAPRLRRFLDDAFDGDFSASDWLHAVGGTHFWLEDEAGIIAHGSVVPRILVCGSRALLAGYVEAVATRKERRGGGLASEVMRAAGAFIADHYELGALSSNADALYEALGWEKWRGVTGVVDDLSALGGKWDPTPEDDGGVMILRTPRTPMLDIDGPIVCERREGDVW